MARILVVGGPPLAANVFVQPSIAFAQRVGPFKVPRFVARGIRVSSVSNENDGRAGRLVRYSTTVRYVVFVPFLRVPVRIDVCRARGCDLVTRRYLIVTFNVQGDLLILTSINRFPRRTTQFPIFVGLLLSYFGPVVQGVRNRAMVGPVSAVLGQYYRPKRAQGFFHGNGHFKVCLVGRLINRYRVAGHVVVLVPIGMVPVVARHLSRTITVVRRQYRAIGAGAIGARLVRPVLAVKRRRVGRLVLAVVGTWKVPYQVFAPPTQVRMLVEVANGVTGSLRFVLRNVEIGGVRGSNGSRSVYHVGRFLRFVQYARAK